MRLTWVVLFSVLPVTLAAADISGAWTGSAGSPMYFVLKQDGDRGRKMRAEDQRRSGAM